MMLKGNPCVEYPALSGVGEINKRIMLRFEKGSSKVFAVEGSIGLSSKT